MLSGVAKTKVKQEKSRVEKLTKLKVSNERLERRLALAEQIRLVTKMSSELKNSI